MTSGKLVGCWMGRSLVGTLEDAIGVDRGLPELNFFIEPVINQAAVPGESLGPIDGGHTIACHQLEDESPVRVGKLVWRKDQTAVRMAREIRDRGFEVGDCVDGNYNDFDGE
jgi:hypothetical protein